MLRKQHFKVNEITTYVKINITTRPEGGNQEGKAELDQQALSF